MKGFETVPETAEQMINAGIQAGIPVEQQRKDPVSQGFYSTQNLNIESFGGKISKCPLKISIPFS